MKKKKKFIIIGIILAILAFLMIRIDLYIKEKGSFLQTDKDFVYNIAANNICLGVELTEIHGISEKSFSYGKEEIDKGLELLTEEEREWRTKRKATELKVIVEGYIEAVENFLDSGSEADEQDVEMYSKKIRDITHEIREKGKQKLKNEKNRL